MVLKQFADGNFHTQFLTDFANGAFLESFAASRLPSGKFPQSAAVPLRVTLGDEQLAVAED
jgi:hypothetical protein